MNETNIEWCDLSWNPVTGCKHGCKYCYAKDRVNRFQGYLLDGQITTFNPHNGPAVLESPLYTADKFGKKRKAAFPYGFDPTLYKYRLGEPAKVKKPKNIFVSSMADLFGEWVSDEWIKQVFAACEAAPQHRYLFLTKNPKRYDTAIPILPKYLEDEYRNYWFGATVTTNQKLGDLCGSEASVRLRFLSIEPIQEQIYFRKRHFLGYIEWIIIGAETGNRHNKVIPKRKWIQDIVKAAKGYNIPIFMKDSLIEIVGEENMIREFPWEVKV